MYELKWEELQDVNPNMRTWRMCVSGGYIYRMIDFNNNAHAIFVPDAQLQDLFNKVAELSMKLNKMESSLREFEKQRVNPVIKEIEELESNMFQAKAAWCLLEKRIETLEQIIEYQEKK